MRVRKNHIFNRQNLILLVIIIFIILINSSQEHYLSLDERRSTSLETVIGSNSTVRTNEPSSSLYTPPPTISQPPNNIQIPANKPFSLFVPVTVAVIILLALLILNIKRDKEIKYYYSTMGKTTKSQLAEAHRRFRTQMRSLVEVLSDYLKRQQYNKGIIFGYHTLDSNMRKLVGMSRDASMTPKEFAQTLNLPEIIPHLETIINLFYLAQYRKKPMTYDELALFIELLSKMEQLSISKEQIKIIERKEII